MPLYDYQCLKCGHVTEVRHGFDDTYAQPCAACGGELRRVINPAPVIFKGSGFYVTDSRKKPAEPVAKSDTPAAAKPDGSAPAKSEASSAPASSPSKESAA